jgi:L-histidine Nalpha-methyltransferase
MSANSAALDVVDLLTGWRARLAEDVRIGLGGSPPTIPSRWLYDEVGSRLFEAITGVPEYYPTRRETEILIERAGETAALSGATTLIELGSGTSTKTRLLIEALLHRAGSLRLVPVDVSLEVLLQGASGLGREYPDLVVVPVAADFLDGLPAMPGDAGERLVAFLGGTIGNLDTEARRGFLTRLRTTLATGDHLLVGADLVKDPVRLVAAYDDGAGVTAAFNRNVITVVARELEADGLRAQDFEHVARWNPSHSRIEMWLRASVDVQAWFPALGLTWRLPRGGEVRTEISVKFHRRRWCRELRSAGFLPVRSWTDAAGDFSLTLARCS